MATLLGCESPCTRGKRRNYSSNIITKFTATKITGQGFSRGTQVGETTFVLIVKPLESWSTETRDLRLESSLKGRRCPRDLAGAVVAPVSSGLTNRLNITGCDFSLAILNYDTTYCQETCFCSLTIQMTLSLLQVYEKSSVEVALLLLALH